MPLSDLIQHFRNDDDRVDGRDLPEPREPGSDALLIRGLLVLVSEIERRRSRGDG